jgi:hypothetical protein
MFENFVENYMSELLPFYKEDGKIKYNLYYYYVNDNTVPSNVEELIENTKNDLKTYPRYNLFLEMFIKTRFIYNSNREEDDFYFDPEDQYKDPYIVLDGASEGKSGEGDILRYDCIKLIQNLKRLILQQLRQINPNSNLTKNDNRDKVLTKYIMIILEEQRINKKTNISKSTNLNSKTLKRTFSTSVIRLNNDNNDNKDNKYIQKRFTIKLPEDFIPNIKFLDSIEKNIEEVKRMALISEALQSILPDLSKENKFYLLHWFYLNETDAHTDPNKY